MRDVLALTLSVALPWVAGTLWIRAALRRTATPAAMICVGYGYLVGLFGEDLEQRGRAGEDLHVADLTAAGSDLRLAAVIERDLPV